MNKQRVVVTGMGLVTPLGCGVETVWQRLTGGASGLRRLPDEFCCGLDAQVGAIVPTVQEDAEAGLDIDRVVSGKDQKKMDRFIILALAAAEQALQQAGWQAQSPHARERTATVIASGIGGFPAIAEAVRTTDQRGPRRLSPFTVPSFLINLAARPGIHTAWLQGTDWRTRDGLCRQCASAGRWCTADSQRRGGRGGLWWCRGGHQLGYASRFRRRPGALHGLQRLPDTGFSAL